MRLSLVLAITLALPLAGCLAGDEPMETASVEEIDANAAAPVAEATAEATPMPPELTPATIAFSYSGNTGIGGCVFMVGVCEFAMAPTEDEHVFTDIQGQPVHLIATFTYADQEPGMEFYVGFCKGDSVETLSCEDYETGASPLVREFDLRADPAGTVYGFSVGSLNPATEPAGAMVFMDATFEATGEIHVLR